MKKKQAINNNDIAIVGMSIKFPQANNLSDFWQKLRDSIDLINKFPEQRKKDTDDFVGPLGIVGKRKYFKAAYLDEVDRFDHNFFHLSPDEAKYIDPVQRIFLETAWSCLEDGGYQGINLAKKKVGVFVGFAREPFEISYLDLVRESSIPATYNEAWPGNTDALIANRIAYYLNLRGPNLVINSACSSSLAALYTAVKFLRDGDCELALVGGANLILQPIDMGLKIKIESSDSKTKSFDDSADGTGWGEGFIALLLKPLKKAICDRDNIYAVIKGGAINHGSDYLVTTPSASAQAELLIRAWQDAKIDPKTISYIEAHGTGTRKGDKIEAKGITEAFRKFTDKKQFCAIGSVKTNIGHLRCASGLAGLTKAVLALENKQIPASLHYRKPHSGIDFKNSPIFVNQSLRSWKTDFIPRRCGVSSFGLGGTNCHIVLEESIYKSQSAKNKNQYQIFTVSAQSEKSLRDILNSYNKFFSQTENLNLGDLCYTANTGRMHFRFRLFFITKILAELKEQISFILQNDFDIEKLKFKNIFYSQLERKDDLKEQQKNDSQIIKINDKNFEELKKIASAYVTGQELDWNKFYYGKKYNKVSLPTYVFDSQRCWLKPVKDNHQNNKIVFKQKDKIINNNFSHKTKSSQIKPANKRSKISDRKPPIIKNSNSLNPEPTERDETIANGNFFTEQNISLNGKKDDNYSASEKKIATICCHVLARKEINIYDNLSEIGIDSLNVIQIRNEIFKNFKVNLNLEKIFDNLTIYDLAILVDSKLKK